MEYEEHEKRAWSVDFSRTEPSMLVSGSDDCKVFGNLSSSTMFGLPKLRKKSVTLQPGTAHCRNDSRFGWSQ